MGQLIFVDTETGGFDPDKDPLVELTWATRVRWPETLYFGVESVPSIVDNLIGFTERGIAGKKSAPHEVDQFLISSENATMVAANPSFDQGFLKVNNLWRFHYRMLDIESYAMAKLDLDYMPGMRDIVNILNERGYEVAENDHTSLNDVIAMKEAFLILEKM